MIREIIVLKWSCNAYRTNLHHDLNHYRGTTEWEKKNPESIWLYEFRIESVVDRHYSRNEAPLGKYLLEFSLDVYGNDRLVGVNDRIKNRLQTLQDAGTISGYYLGLRQLVYFNPIKGEQFTRTALKVATQVFNIFGVPKRVGKDFTVIKETQVKTRDSKGWVDFATHLKSSNKDLLD